MPADREAGVVVFRRTERGVRFLVAAAHARWDFPHGPVIAGESEINAAQRHVAAETGVADLHFAYGDTHMETLPGADGRTARYFIAETEDPDGAETERPASRGGASKGADACRWVSVDEAEDLLPPRLGIILDWACATIAEG